jgi:hypothetical protein
MTFENINIIFLVIWLDVCGFVYTYYLERYKRWNYKKLREECFNMDLGAWNSGDKWIMDDLWESDIPF